ncbi:MAG TPA: ferritin-like domain-containing protein [Myxococcota bacterium]|nr:ferritin-like domain-containing protein [Myxococcota bacterium]
MRRFLPPRDLARDLRFKRANSKNELFRTLPDDVGGIVRVLERVGPKLRERVAGTALEAVFDDLGPGFMFLTTAAGTAQSTERTPLQLRAQLHGIFVGELQALEAASRTLWDFPDAPWEFKMNMARQCWDEARHVQIYEKLIHHVGGELGEFPENTFLYETSCVEDPVLRVAGVNRCLEGLACDAFRSLIEYGRANGEAIIEQAIDFVLADELTHVRFGSDWVKEFTRDDPERARRAAEFQRETDTRFSFGTRAVAREERIEAGFTEDELRELDAILEQGPKRKTLVDAALILKDRHRARRRGEAVAPYGG